MVRTCSRAAFLDRDGVLIHTPVVRGKAYAIRSLEEFRLLPGVSGAVRRLKEAGYAIIVVTNQPDIDNGLVTNDIVDAIHRQLRDELPIDALYCCPHDKRRKCDCRKPRPGMLLRAAEELKLDLAGSWMVGDRESDVAAGKSAGCRVIFIDCGYDESAPTAQDATVRSLAEAADFILKSEEL